MVSDEVIKVGYKEYKFPEWKGYENLSEMKNIIQLGCYSNVENIIEYAAKMFYEREYFKAMLLWIQAKCYVSEDGRIFLCLNSARELFDIMIVSCESMKEFGEKMKE